MTEIAAYRRKRRPTLATGATQPVSMSLTADQPGRNDAHAVPGASRRSAAGICTEVAV